MQGRKGIPYTKVRYRSSNLESHCLAVRCSQDGWISISWELQKVVVLTHHSHLNILCLQEVIANIEYTNEEESIAGVFDHCWTTCSSSQLKRLHQRDRKGLCLGTGLVKHYMRKQYQDTWPAKIAAKNPRLIKANNQSFKTWAGDRQINCSTCYPRYNRAQTILNP